ncbi:MAG: hypothetical protein L6N95_03395 [Candidatus Methylarchaceae archaeon HK01B]|nr:hypothetical protein [Candidatus Methylarchaceae archaeon HK01M]MCP8312179.1 hypothetical protein [Candidatus Methylarchaceae archaeon HK02M1]MCP8318855.1 hypothetical protein [Candidatus Methylarchaceae archaeon HK01B]
MEWIVPIIVPLIIGLLIGIIIKHTIKLAIVVIALILILGAVGYIALPSIQEILQKAVEYLPKIWEVGSLLNLLPYSSIAFLIGLAIGLWKG